MPNVKINSFGHIGDGNIHYNLSPPEGQKSFNNMEKEFAYELGKLVTKMEAVLQPSMVLEDLKLS